MPSNKHFSFEILIGGQPAPEYEKDGMVYVESNLNTPLSYYQRVSEYAATTGEFETQETDQTILSDQPSLLVSESTRLSVPVAGSQDLSVEDSPNQSTVDSPNSSTDGFEESATDSFEESATDRVEESATDSTHDPLERFAGDLGEFNIPTQLEYPVTPYQITVQNNSKKKAYYFRILVDGEKVKCTSIAPSLKRVIKGFRDGHNIREFLFSLPRFPHDENDLVSDARKISIGRIEVQCWKAWLRKSVRATRECHLDFQQASKKDTSRVTDGQYTMATSRAGRTVSTRDVNKSVDKWSLVKTKSSLCILYRMGHTLQELGFTLKPMHFKRSANTFSSGARKRKKYSLQNGPREIIEIDLTNDDSGDDQEKTQITSGSGLGEDKLELPATSTGNSYITLDTKHDSKNNDRQKSLETATHSTPSQGGDTNSSSAIVHSSLAQPENKRDSKNCNTQKELETLITELPSKNKDTTSSTGTPSDVHSIVTLPENKRDSKNTSSGESRKTDSPVVVSSGSPRDGSAQPETSTTNL